MKKLFRTLCSGLFLFSLASCGQKREESVSSSFSDTSLEVETFYHVTFLNEDETLLFEEDVLKGSEAIYQGEVPTKEEDDEFIYEFVGWDQELTNVNADIVTKATYKAIAKEGWGPIIWF